MDEQFIDTPEGNFENPIYSGSMQRVLAMNLGELVNVEFLIGTTQNVTKSGILYAVGEKTIVLYQQRSETYVLCDIFSIKFVTFIDQRMQPSPVTIPKDMLV